MDFHTEYQALMDRLLPIYDALRKNLGNPTRNNMKLERYKGELDILSREIDRLREKYKEQYQIYDTIEGVQSTHRYILDDMKQIYMKPRVQNQIPNFGTNKPRRSSFSTLDALRNRFKKFTQRRKSFGGSRQTKTRKH
jgi:isoleucyl-tRNA synthetase